MGFTFLLLLSTRVPRGCPPTLLSLRLVTYLDLSEHQICKIIPELHLICKPYIIWFIDTTIVFLKIPFHLLLIAFTDRGHVATNLTIHLQHYHLEPVGIYHRWWNYTGSCNRMYIGVVSMVTKYGGNVTGNI